MRNKLIGIPILVLLLVLSAQVSNAQSIKKYVIGAGGSIELTGTDNSKMSCTIGQGIIARESVSGTIGYFGFWRPQVWTSVEEPTVTVSGELSNYPNPFDAKTTIRYTLTESSKVTIKIFDMTGNTVRNLLSDEAQDASTSSPYFDSHDDAGNPLASGTYVCEVTVKPLQNPGAIKIMRNIMVIVK